MMIEVIVEFRTTGIYIFRRTHINFRNIGTIVDIVDDEIKRIISILMRKLKNNDRFWLNNLEDLVDKELS